MPVRDFLALSACLHRLMKNVFVKKKNNPKHFVVPVCYIINRAIEDFYILFVAIGAGHLLWQGIGQWSKPGCFVIGENGHSVCTQK